MIGSIIRKKQEAWTRKYFNLIFDRPQFRGLLSYRQKEKILSFAVGWNEFVMSVAFFLALVTVFMKFILPRLEFERTVVLMLVILMFLLRSFLEKMGRES